MKTVNLYKLAKIVSDDIKEIGLRPGEKLYEELISKKELPYRCRWRLHIYSSKNIKRFKKFKTTIFIRKCKRNDKRRNVRFGCRNK